MQWMTHRAARIPGRIIDFLFIFWVEMSLVVFILVNNSLGSGSGILRSSQEEEEERYGRLLLNQHHQDASNIEQNPP